jgi:hypothetical protein
MSRQPNIPPFFELLTPADQEGYEYLRSQVSSDGYRHHRHHRLDAFSTALSSIRSYCEKGDADDSLRSLVCGVCHLSDSIAVNVRRLRFLVEKCKSSINGSFQRMGYLPFVGKTASLDVLSDRIPQIRGNYTELREWSFRRLEVIPQQPFLSHYRGFSVIVTETPTFPMSSYRAPGDDWPDDKDDLF